MKVCVCVCVCACPHMCVCVSERETVNRIFSCFCVEIIFNTYNYN